MAATIDELERQYGLGGGLLHRHLQNQKVTWKEGAFLAGTFWVAHYWVKRGELAKATEQIGRGLAYANDLGLFPEEIDPNSGEMLGNIPLGLVHGSFLAAVADLHAAAGSRSGQQRRCEAAAAGPARESASRR